MVEKRLTGASPHLQGILSHDNTREIKPHQPSTNLCCRRPFGEIDLQSTTLRQEAADGHLLIDPTPERIERTERRKGQHELTSWFEMCHQSLNDFETVGTEKHDREIARDAVKTWQSAEAVRAYPGIRTAATGVVFLESLARSNLTPTEIDGQDLPRGPHQLCEIECRNPMATGDIENGRSRAKVQMLQQRLSEGVDQ